MNTIIISEDGDVIDVLADRQLQVDEWLSLDSIAYRVTQVGHTAREIYAVVIEQPRGMPRAIELAMEKRARGGAK